MSGVKFFIPLADDPGQEQGVYDSIKKFLHKELGADLSDRKVYRLAWTKEGKSYVAQVGEENSFNRELVIAIFYEPLRDLYHVCTPNRGVARGMSILVGSMTVTESWDFDDE